MYGILVAFANLCIKKSQVEKREEKSRLGVTERRACCCGHVDSFAISGAADFLTMSWTESLERLHGPAVGL